MWSFRRLRELQVYSEVKLKTARNMKSLLFWRKQIFVAPETSTHWTRLICYKWSINERFLSNVTIPKCLATGKFLNVIGHTGTYSAPLVVLWLQPKGTKVTNKVTKPSISHFRWHYLFSRTFTGLCQNNSTAHSRFLSASCKSTVSW
jgi:hypothetical protein